MCRFFTAFFVLFISVIPALQVSAAPLDRLEERFPSAACEISLGPDQVAHILKLDPILHAGFSPTVQFHRALQYLQSLPHPTQLQLAISWEKLGEHIAKENPGIWDMNRAFGPDGEIVYYGEAAHALIITKDAKLIRGFVFSKDVSEEKWNGVYTLHTKLPPSDIPQSLRRF